MSEHTKSSPDSWVHDAPHVFIPRADGFLYCQCGAGENDSIHRPSCATCSQNLVAIKGQQCTDCAIKLAEPPTTPQHDPDYLNPSKGGNRASDDYW